MTEREEKALRHVDKNGLGIEIGPSYNPLASKKAGYQVHIIDHLSREDLVEKYTTHPVDVANIEEVDFIWHGETYTELVGNRHHYDWVIASHVIEHTPDMVDFLNNCDELLKDTGVLSLMIPDKRRCFDYFRPLTGLGQVVDAHLQKRKNHSPGSVYEFFLNAVTIGDTYTWSENQPDAPFTYIYDAKKAQEKMEEAIRNEDYVDSHAWTFVPHSFRLLIHDLHAMGLIKLQEVDFYPSSGCEFFMTLSRTGKGSGLSRLEMSRAMNVEVVDTPPPAPVPPPPPSVLRRIARKVKRTFIPPPPPA